MPIQIKMEMELKMTEILLTLQRNILNVLVAIQM